MMNYAHSQDFLKYADALHNFAFRLTKDTEDAEDLVQETYYRVLKHRDQFQKGTNLKAWMFTILRNLFINRYRKESKRQKILLSGESKEMSTNKLHVFNQAFNNLRWEELQAMVDKLLEKHKTPFTMRFQGYTYEEIAAKLNLPLGTVKSRVFAARRKLIKGFKLNS